MQKELNIVCVRKELDAVSDFLLTGGSGRGRETTSYSRLRHFSFIPLLWQCSTEKASWGGGLACFIPPAKWKRNYKYFCLLVVNSDSLRQIGATPPKALRTATPSCRQAHVRTDSELAQAAQHTRTFLNNLDKIYRHTGLLTVIIQCWC